MRFETYAGLTAISDRWPYDFAKIVQLLLAIALGPRGAGYLVDNQLSEGVDITLLRQTEKIATEVKTTQNSEVVLSEKDIDGLMSKYTRDQYIPTVAVLRLQLTENWVVANATTLTTGSYSPTRLSLYSAEALQSDSNRHFPSVVGQLKEAILNPPGCTPLEYLARTLKTDLGRI
jgi:Holliday junction resolvase